MKKVAKMLKLLKYASYRMMNTDWINFIFKSNLLNFAVLGTYRKILTIKEFPIDLIYDNIVESSTPETEDLYCLALILCLFY